MVQVKEFIDTDISSAEQKANDFLATLDEEQIVGIHYSTGYKPHNDQAEQRSNILIVYRTK